LSRRMWVSSKIQFLAPLLIGETVLKQSRVSSVELKRGSSGPLMLLTVVHEYSVGGELRISEQQTLVYLEKDSGGGPERKGDLYTETSDWSRLIQPGPVLLFRYSALTSNTHRIHYDREYAQREEGLPGLLVHGPLTATLLAQLAHENCPGQRLIEFNFRALRPLVEGRPFSIHGKHEQGDKLALWALDSDGYLAVQASARITKL